MAFFNNYENKVGPENFTLFMMVRYAFKMFYF